MSALESRATPVQFLDERGERVSSDVSERFARYADEVTGELLQSFYRDMTIARRFDEEAAALQRQGQLALWVPSIGQEGGQVGAASATRPQDWIFPAYRELVMARVRGVDLMQLIDLLRGNTHGSWDWRGTHFHQYTLVIGAQALHGTGFAMGLALDGKAATGSAESDAAVLTCFGDGATSEGAVSEAFVFATSYQAPVVFFCQNNGWAISVPTATQAHAPLVGRAAGFGLDAVRIDGNDAIAGYAVARALLDGARTGAGPGFIESVTYRIGAHTSSDDPTKYRTSDEVERWRRLDPIARVRTRLEADGSGSAFFTEVDEEAADVAADLRTRIVARPRPEPDSMFRNVYSEPHPVMEAEAAWLADYESSLGGGDR